MAWAICILVFGSAINTITAAAAAVHAERLRTRSALFFSIRALSIPACNRSRPASGIVIFSYSSFNCFNCSCSFISILHLSGLFGPVMLSLPISFYISFPVSVLCPEYIDVGGHLLSLCCLRGSAAAFSSPGTVCSLPCSGSHPVSSRSPPAACPQRISEPQWHDPSGQDFL